MGTSSIANLEEKILALLCYFPYITIIVSIIVIILEKQSVYCLFHGWQALLFVVTYIIGAIILGIIDAFIPIFNILTFLWAVLFIVVWIILMIFAYKRAESGNPLMLPLIGPFSMKQAEKRIGGGSGGGSKTTVEPQGAEAT